MRVLVVEDEVELADLVAAALRKAGLAVDTVGRLDDARVAVATVEYDAVILDLGLPDGDGTALLEDLRRRDDPAPVLILTARDAVEDRIAGLDRGAEDYLLKPFHMDELVARVKVVLRRPRSGATLRLESGNVALDVAHREVVVGARPVGFARREIALLEMLLRRAGRVVTKDAIEEHLYSFDEPVGSNAVEVNVHRLRRRLAEAGATVEVHTLRGVGYMLGPGKA